MQKSFPVLSAAVAACILVSTACAPAAGTDAQASPAPQPTMVVEPAVQPVQPAAPDSQPAEPTQELSDNVSSAVLDRLAAMTLQEKVGQLFFVRRDALDPAQT